MPASGAGIVADHLDANRQGWKRATTLGRAAGGQTLALRTGRVAQCVTTATNVPVIVVMAVRARLMPPQEATRLPTSMVSIPEKRGQGVAMRKGQPCHIAVEPGKKSRHGGCSTGPRTDRRWLRADSGGSTRAMGGGENKQIEIRRGFIRVP